MRWRPAAPAHGDGAERVGWLAEAHPLERGFVLMLRAWLDGPSGQAAVWRALVRSAGAAGARCVLVTFEAFLEVVARGASRPFRRHATRCPCLGADEAALSGLVRTAAEGRRAEAGELVRGLLREADMVAIVEQAARLGVLLDAAGAGPETGQEAWSLLRAAPVDRTLH